MIKNYIKIAFRNLGKQKLYSLINVFGLTLGIACCLIIYLFVKDEFSFDKFHEEADNIFRVEEVRYQKPKAQIEPSPFFDRRSPAGIYKSPWLPLPLGPAMADRFPEIENIVRVDESSLLVRKGEQVFEEDILFAESSFFEVFTFPLLKGSPREALKDPASIVLTPETARKYFDSEDVVGESLIITIRNEDKVFTVSGVAEEPPKNSSIPFSFVAPIESRPYYDFHIDRWNSFNTPLFVKLAQGAAPGQLEEKLNQLAEERYGDNWDEARKRQGLPKGATVMEFVVSPLTGIHLDAAIEWPSVSNPMYSYILGAIALLILVIACINYITLALARSPARAREVGIRKASGANRGQIALQFWGETQLLTIIAMTAGVCLAELTLPLFNSLSGKTLAISYFDDAGFLGLLLGTTFLTGIIAGSYPAIILSGFQPVKVLKGLTSFRMKPRITKALLVLQYSLSVFLIISSLVMYRQLDYVSGKDLGYNEDQVVFVPTHTGWDETGTQLMERYRDRLKGEAGVTSVSGMAPAFTKGSNRYGFDINGERKTSYIYFVDHNIIKTLDFEVVAGRDFSQDRPSDIKNSIIVNQALVESMGWDEPIGQLLPWKGEENPSTVIGVVKDFHFQSLETDIQPMLFHMDPEQGGVASIAVKLEEGAIGETLPKLEAAWKEVAPYRPFNFWFLDEAVDRQYEDYRRWLKIMGVSTMMAIVIACLGLFGLAGLTAVNKTKEIGIRKVLGAGVNQIILLLNKDIVKLILISLVLAAPLSWYIMEQWLADFAYRITINAGIYGLAMLLALVIAVATVSYHSIRAALINPVDSLRSE